MKINQIHFRKSFLPAILFMALVWYATAQGYAAIRGPNLEILNPKNNARISGEAVTLTGKTETGSKISINNVPTAVTDHGEFTATAAVSPGKVATYTIVSEDRHGKRTIKELTLVTDYPHLEEMIITKTDPTNKF